MTKAINEKGVIKMMRDYLSNTNNEKQYLFYYLCFSFHRVVSTKAELRLDLINSPWIPDTIVDKLKEQVSMKN